MPTYQLVDTFVHGRFSTAGGGLYSAIFGTPTKVTTPLWNSGAASLEINSPGNEGVRHDFTGSPSRTWVGFPFRMAALPTVGSMTIFGFQTVSGSAGRLYVQTNGNLHAFIGGGGDVQGPTLVAGTWYWIEAIFDVSGATHSLYWRVDGVDKTAPTLASTPQTVEFAQLLSFASDGTATWYAGGWATGSAGSTTDWSGTLSFRAYAPNADGTHSVGSDTFRYTDNDGGAFTNITNPTTVAWQRVDEWPDDQAGTDDWIDKSAGTVGTTYVEIAFADEATLGDPVAVRALAALEESAAADGLATLKLVEGTTEHGTAIFSADIGATTPVYKSKMYATKPTGGAWTNSALDGAKVRISSSNPVSSNPRVKALLLEAAFSSVVGQTFVLPWESLAAVSPATLGGVLSTQLVSRVYAAQTRGPLASDDSTTGTAAGDLWIYSGSAWVCINAAAGVAIWKQVTA